MNLSPHSRNPACSAYAKADNEGSLRFLDEVLRICLRANVTAPSTQAFLSSLFADNHGWGKPLSTAQRDAWRAQNGAKSTA